MTTTWEDIYCKAKSAAQTAGKKTCDMVELAKLKLTLAEERRDLTQLFEKLGRLAFLEKQTDADITHEMQSTMEHIKQQQKTIAKLQATIDMYKKGRRCGSCDTFNPNDAAYCKKCGRTL